MRPIPYMFQLFAFKTMGGYKTSSMTIYDASRVDPPSEYPPLVDAPLRPGFDVSFTYYFVSSAIQVFYPTEVSTSLELKIVELTENVDQMIVTSVTSSSVDLRPLISAVAKSGAACSK